MPLFVLQEYNEASDEAFREYTVSVSRDSVVSVHPTTKQSHHQQSNTPIALTSLIKSVRNLFLPLGYPQTVRPGYGQYQLYDSLQGLCSYLRGVVSSAHVLHAAGVGNDKATAWSAALTWALRDGMGMLGGLGFAAWASPLFDSYVKEFRFFADLINNVGLTLDMLSPVIPPSKFLWVAAASTLCKTMCGMSAGATKGSITAHFAVGGNLADLHAKEGTQETLVSLLGMTCGIGLARYFQTLERNVEEGLQTSGTAWTVQWITFAALTALHIWSNYRAVHILRLRTLNRQRAVHVLEPLLKKLSAKQNLVGEDVLEGLVGPDQVDESLGASTWHMLLPERLSSVVLGARLVDVVQGSGDILDVFREDAYVLSVNRRGQILVSLLKHADGQTELKAFVHLLLLQQAVNDCSSIEKIRRTRNTIQDLFGGKVDLWKRLKEKGWDLEGRLYLGFSRRRSCWSIAKEE